MFQKISMAYLVVRTSPEDRPAEAAPSPGSQCPRLKMHTGRACLSFQELHASYTGDTV